MAKYYFFSIKMNYLDCQALYDSAIKYVVVRDREGKNIQLDKQHVKKFLTPKGIHGDFKLEVDHFNKFKSLVCLHQK